MKQWKLVVLCLGFAVAGGGCAGVYAELTASQLLSASVSPSGGGDAVDVDGASTIGLNVGVEFGSTRHRFAMGYAYEALSVDDESVTGTGAGMRYDFNLVNLADRLKLRLGLATEFGNGDDGNMYGAFAGLGATYFLTWKNALHVFAGARAVGHSVAAGNLVGTGVSGRITLSHTFGDGRPDQEIFVPLQSNRNVVGLIEAGAAKLGCVTTSRTGSSTYAWLGVACPGGRYIRYFQIAQGMMITCRNEQSKSSCRKLSESIVEAAVELRTQPPAPMPAPQPLPAVAPAPDPLPAPAPEAAPPSAPSSEDAPVAPGQP